MTVIALALDALAGILGEKLLGVAVGKPGIGVDLLERGVQIVDAVERTAQARAGKATPERMP